VNTFARWSKFNLVGALGMVVQLSALAAINRLAPGHYLFATMAAIELTLLHNFTWHLHYTWFDRRDDRIGTQCIRFHLSNGMVSMIGNLILMRVLVHSARIRLLASNSIAILSCSIVNFILGSTWTFPIRERPT
jgi:putative flippase GtrA